MVMTLLPELGHSFFLDAATPTTMVTPESVDLTIVRRIIVSNTTSAGHYFNMYQPYDVEAASSDNIILNQWYVPANETEVFDVQMGLYGAGGLMVEDIDGQVLDFFAYGEIGPRGYHEVAKLLGRVRPSDTNTATLYTCTAGYTTMVTTVFVSNLDGANQQNFRLHIDNDGALFTQFNRIYSNKSLAKNQNLIVPRLGAGMNVDAASIGFRSSLAGNMICSVYGIESIGQ